MESESPMDRLICGDVGFGKTEIAIRAAFKAVNDSKQVAVLVPTTILALQHFKTFSDRLAELPATVDYLNRFKSAAQQKETLEKAAERLFPVFQRSTPFGSKYSWTPHKEREAFKRGAKWQAERMYSEEEVLDILSDCDGSVTQAKKWFEQFKKK
jgi:hypothetical protein